jgi:type IV secretion system protein TrbI
MNTTPSNPPGVIPKNTNRILLAVVAVVIFIATVASGKKAQKAVESQPPAGPSPGQLSNFKAGLERRAREAEEARKALEKKQEELGKAALVPPAPAIPTAGYAAPDPLREQRRMREAKAPFASNFVVQRKDEPITPDRSPQLIAQIGKEAGESKEKLADRPKESGRLLPPQEGGLFRVYEGTTVSARLVNRLDGSFTGPVTCVSDKAIRSKTGKVTLIPAGSVFFGTAARVVMQNQTRLAVTFKRLLMPNGYSVDLESAPGLDRVGETGLKDKVNNHRLRTFGVAGAIGLLGGFALFRGNPYAAGVANTTGNAATNALNQFLNAVPTITIREGHEVLVYLPTDLLLPAYKPDEAERTHK